MDSESDSFEVRHLTVAEINAETSVYDSDSTPSPHASPLATPPSDPDEPPSAQPRTFTPDTAEFTQSCFTSSWIRASDVTLDPLSDDEPEFEPNAKRRRLDVALELRDMREAAEQEADRPVMRELSNLEWRSGQERFEHIAVGKRALVTQNETTVDNRPYVYLFVLRKMADGWARQVHKVMRADMRSYFDVAWSSCNGCLDAEPNQAAHMGPGGCCEFE
jgi:hypothetical protein